jgi:hypothetical protein
VNPGLVNPCDALGALNLSIVETILIFAGIPALIVLLVFAAVYLGSGSGSGRRSKRYRPGRPFDFTPVWFLSAPEAGHAGHATPALAGPERQALPAGEAAPGASTSAAAAKGEWPASEMSQLQTTGGTSERW